MIIERNKFRDNDFMDDIYSGQTEGEEYNKVILYREELKDALMHRCSLNNSDFIDCGLEGAVLDDSIIIDATFKQCDMKETSFANCTLVDVRFIDCKIDDIDFSGARLTNVKFIRCDGAVIGEDGDWVDVLFVYCDIQDSNLSDTAMFTVCFRWSNLNDTCFDGSYAMGVSFEKTSIEGADLNWSEVDVLTTDGYVVDPSEKKIKPKIKWKTSTDNWVRLTNNSGSRHNAVLTTG